MAGAFQENLVLQGTGGNVKDQNWVNLALMADLLLKQTTKMTLCVCFQIEKK